MWWCNLDMEYKVQIIATLSGAFIAIITTFLAYRFNKLQEQTNSKQLYFQTLNITEANFDWHLGQLNRLSTSIDLLRESSLIDRKIVVDYLPVKLETSILLKIIDNLIPYKKGNKDLIKLLIVYVNHLEELNYQLKFDNANKTISALSEEQSINDGINDFFDAIQKEYIDKIKKEIQLSRQLIEIEHKKKTHTN